MTEWGNGRGALILVHPGSAFTSWRRQVEEEVFANFVASLEHDLATCTDLVVIDGMLSDGVPSDIDRLIESRLNAIGQNAGFAARLWGCDAGEQPFPSWSGRNMAGDAVFGSQQDAARAIAAYLPDNGPVICTGAWATRDGSSGCVNSVAESLATRIDPARIRISESAAYEEDAFGFDADGLDL